MNKKRLSFFIYFIKYTQAEFPLTFEVTSPKFFAKITSATESRDVDKKCENLPKCKNWALLKLYCKVSNQIEKHYNISQFNLETK